MILTWANWFSGSWDEATTLAGLRNFPALPGLSRQRPVCLIRILKKRGYEVHFLFLWIPTVRLALARVRARVLEGGHDVPVTVIRRRFHRSIRNFLLHYRPLGDSWTLFDNSAATPSVIAFEKRGSLGIIEPDTYESLIAGYEKP